MRMTWQGFLRRYRRETGVRLLLRLNTKTSSATRVDLLKQPWGPEWLDKLEEMRRRYKTNDAAMDNKDPDDWWELGSGGFMRLTHINHDYERAG